MSDGSGGRKGSLTVLCAPATRRWQVHPVSEDGWLPTVITHMQSLEPGLSMIAMVEECEVPDRAGLRIRKVGHRHHELLGSVTMPVRLAAAAIRDGALDQVDLVHVGLPFAVGRTQSLLAFLARRRGLPVVVGPIQAPQTFLGSDETAASDEARGRPRSNPSMVAQQTGRLILGATAPLLRAGNRALLAMATEVVAVDRNALAALCDAGVDQRRCTIIPHPLSWVPAEPPVTVGFRPLRLLAAGVLIERKAVDQIIEAVALLRRAGVEVTLTVAGTGPAEQALRRLASERRIADAVEFAGWLSPPQMRAAMERSTFFVTMSRSEAFPVTVIDALAAGVPTISAANHGATSLLRHGVTGWLVPIDDPRALASQVTALIETPSAVQTVARQGATWARRALAPDVVASQWLEVYRRAAVPVPGGSSFVAGRGPR